MMTIRRSLNRPTRISDHHTYPSSVTSSQRRHHSSSTLLYTRVDLMPRTNTSRHLARHQTLKDNSQNSIRLNRQIEQNSPTPRQSRHQNIGRASSQPITVRRARTSHPRKRTMRMISHPIRQVSSPHSTNATIPTTTLFTTRKILKALPSSHFRRRTFTTPIRLNRSINPEALHQGSLSAKPPLGRRNYHAHHHLNHRNRRVHNRFQIKNISITRTRPSRETKH